MSPTMQMAAPSTAAYTPTTDVIDRHDYGVSKNRKAASTGGGRAWSEDEEVYLLQTRLQKMPYKHIAAHLKKTELACRLHYHQLSHGSNRRKRTTSVSSGSSTGGHSPVMPTTIPSPIHESSSRSSSPPGSAGSSYGPVSPGAIQLPSIVTGGNGQSPRLPAILPKPASMTLALTSSSPTASRVYHTTLPEVVAQHSAPLMPAAGFVSTPTASSAPHSATHATHSHTHAQPSQTHNSHSHSHNHHHHSQPTLRLDCSALPPPPSAPVSHMPVDMSRLSAIYAAHRGGFWAAIATEYGAGASPTALEQAWRSSACPHGASVQQTATPITPVLSPEDREIYGIKSDKTRISAILGIDADPRSPKEREMVRRLEEMVGV